MVELVQTLEFCGSSLNDPAFFNSREPFSSLALLHFTPRPLHTSDFTLAPHTLYGLYFLPSVLQSLPLLPSTRFPSFNMLRLVALASIASVAVAQSGYGR
jgi:hypothetical protein